VTFREEDTMIERDPLFRESAYDRLRAAGELRRAATIDHSANEARIRRELEQVDAAVIGSTPDELRELREAAAQAAPPRDDRP
jgi:hypothetical protein